tara:strand:- start:49 stop:213 length:165 start_codon:yes stop_codon:yes gene_type:complete
MGRPAMFISGFPGNLVEPYREGMIAIMDIAEAGWDSGSVPVTGCTMNITIDAPC